MANDRNRIVTLDASGTATTVKDFNDLTNYYVRKDTFQVHPGAAKPVMAERQRRYGGSSAVAETEENGTISWSAIVKGATNDNALARAEEIFATLRAPRKDLFVEWRQGGATASTFYEVRGPASITPTYSSVMFNDAKAWQVDVEIPVAPLALATPTTYTISSTAFPAVLQLSPAIPGSAPAIANVTVRTSGGPGTGPGYANWLMIGWTKRPGTPLGGSVAPFGIIEAEAATSLSTGLSVTADALYRGGSGVKVNTGTTGPSATASFAIDPSVMDVDDWALSDIDIEVWARVELASTIVTPTVTGSLSPPLGFGQYTAEYGSAGHALTKPSSGTSRGPVKIGTLSMPIDKSQPLSYTLNVTMSWGGGSSGNFGLDYLWLVPARQRALSPTGKPLDSSYPRLVTTQNDTQKRIMGADLSGMVASGAGNFGRDSGLGGSPIELPVGNVDMLIKFSDKVPDDPTVAAGTNDQISQTATGSVVVWPRFWLSKGA